MTKPIPLILSLSTIALTVVCSTYSSAANHGKFTDQYICKAGIATIMGRDPAIMKIDRVQSDVIYLSYVRDDGEAFSYKCRIEGNRVMWGSATGRWRTHSEDSKVSFKVDGDMIIIVDAFSDGSFNKQSFKIENFAQ